MSESQELIIYAGQQAITTPAEDIEAGDLAESSERIYALASRKFLAWCAEHNLSVFSLTHQDMRAYRKYLQRTHSKSYAQLLLTVARQALQELVYQGKLAENPARNVKGFKGLSGETTPRRVLSEDEARQLLHIIDTSTIYGLRDYAILLLLIRTGMRRDELCKLTLASMTKQDGYDVLRVVGKGDKRRLAKIADPFKDIHDVRDAIENYLTEARRDPLYQRRLEALARDMPLFGSLRKYKYGQLDGSTIWRIVKRYAMMIAIDELTPHSLRATFITLALEHKAPLYAVQYTAGHADPRTTERYFTNKSNLVDNATDVLDIS